MDFNYNVAGGYNFNGGTFVAYVDKEGIIWREGTSGRSIAGYDIKYVDEMRERLDEYYIKLVDLGEIKLPKTPEEIMQEQAKNQEQVNNKFLEAITNLNNQMKELINNANTDNTTELASEDDITNSRKKSTGNK